MAEGILPDHKRVDMKQIKSNNANGMSSQRLEEPYKLSEIQSIYNVKSNLLPKQFDQ